MGKDRALWSNRAIFYIRNVLNPGNPSVSILADSTIMFRIILILTAVFTGFSTQAQTEPLTKAEKEALIPCL